MSEAKPLLVSFHRELADHQKVAVARALCGPDATLDRIKCDFRYRRFDEANPEKTAHEVVNELAATHQDWLERQVIYVAPGLPCASAALTSEFGKYKSRGLDARQLRTVARTAPRKGSTQPVPVDPVIYVADKLMASLSATRPETTIAPELYADYLPQQVVLLDMAAPCVAGEGAARNILWHELWRSSDMGDFYPLGFRPVHAGAPRFPQMEDEADGWIEQFKTRLEGIAKQEELVWSSEPLVLSWLGASGNQMAAALAVLHGLSGGFPNCVLYAPRKGQPADCYENCRAEIVSARTFRQKYHPAPRGDTPPAPRRATSAEDVGPWEAPPTALSWLVHFWARDFHHARDHNRRCDVLLAAPLTPDGKTIAEVLPTDIGHVHTMHCRDADRAHGRAEWEPLMWANEVFAYRVGLGLYRTSPQCRPVSEVLQSLANEKNAGGGTVSVEVPCHAQDRIALSREMLSDVLRDMVTTCASLGGNKIVLRYADLHLGLAHNGKAPDSPTVERIREGKVGQGTSRLLACAGAHAATLRVLWQGTDGPLWTGKDGGEWAFDRGAEGCPLELTREPESEWWEIVRYGGRVPRAGWELPAGMTTLWEFELPEILRCCEPKMPTIDQ